MFAQVIFLFAWIAAMQCTAIANPLLCPYGSATECHEGLRLRRKEMVSHAAGLVHSAAEQSGGGPNNNKPGSVAVDQIQKLIDDAKKAQTDATAAEKDCKARAVKAQEEVVKAEEEIQKHKAPSTSGSSWWGTPTRTPVFQWDEAFINTAKGYADSASEKAEQAKSKADNAVQTAQALKNAQSTPKLDAGAVEKTEEYLSIEKSIEDANSAIAEVKKHADAAEVAAYYVKTMMVSHDVFKTVENITYMSTKSKKLIKEAEDGLKEAASYLDIIPRKYVTKVKEFMEPIKDLLDPLKELQVTSEQAVNYIKALQRIITEDKERMKDMTSVQEAKCTLDRASAAVVLINKVAEPVKSQTPFLNGAIEKGDAAKAKGLTARFAYTMWSTFKATKEEIQEIKEAVAKEKEEEERQKKEKEGQVQPPTPPVAKLFKPSLNIPSEVKLPNCNAGGSGGDQTVNLGVIKPEIDPGDSTVPIEGNDQEKEVKAADASGSGGEREGDKGESFRTAERPSSDGAISTKEPVDEKDIRPADSTESNEFSDNVSSKRGPRREGRWDSASTIPSACAYALLTLIMFLVIVQR